MDFYLFSPFLLEVRPHHHHCLWTVHVDMDMDMDMDITLLFFSIYFYLYLYLHLYLYISRIFFLPHACQTKLVRVQSCFSFTQLIKISNASLSFTRSLAALLRFTLSWVSRNKEQSSRASSSRFPRFLLLVFLLVKFGIGRSRISTSGRRSDCCLLGQPQLQIPPSFPCSESS